MRIKKLIFAGLGFCLLNCSNINKQQGVDNNLHQSPPSARLDSLPNEQYVKFKQWVKDTLSSFNRRDSFDLAKDSLLLVIIHSYNLEERYKSQSKVQDVETMIDLLKEYRELPKESFNLKFSMKFEYSPTPVSDQMYDMYSYPEGIEIRSEKEHSVSFYSYLRGRLLYKIVKSTNGERDKQTDFIWEGNKLIKKSSPN